MGRRRSTGRTFATALMLGAILAPHGAAAAPATTGTPMRAVSADAWQGWLTARQREFARRTADVPLAVDMRAIGSAEAASFRVSGTVNPDGSMLVEFDSTARELTVLCSTPTTCWARPETAAADARWHRIPGADLASVREPLPMEGVIVSDEASYYLAGSTGRFELTADDVEVRATVSFADGSYRYEERLADMSEGVSATVSKVLTPTTRVTASAPSAGSIGRPLTADVLPRLPR